MNFRNAQNAGALCGASFRSRYITKYPAFRVMNLKK